MSAYSLVRFLEKRGLIERDGGTAFLSLDSDPTAMDQVRSSSITYRIALGKYKGQKALTLKTLPETNNREKPFLSKHSGFSLNKGVSTKVHQREKPERICRYISRPSLSEQRLSLNSRGKVIFPLTLISKKGFEVIRSTCITSPLERIRRMMESGGLRIASKTLYSLCFFVHCYLEGIVRRIQAEILNCGLSVHLDESPWPIGNRKEIVI